MSYKIEEESDFLNKLKALDYPVPEGFAFLPLGMNGTVPLLKTIYPDSVLDIKKIFKQKGIIIKELSESNLSYRTQKNSEWLGPILFISFSVLSDNSDLVNISLNVLSNYVTDFFKGDLNTKNVKLDVFIEARKNVTYKKITYEGNTEGLKELAEIIKTLKDNE